MRRLLALATGLAGLAAAGSAAACERYDPCRRPPPPPPCRCERPVYYEHRYAEREIYRPRVQEVRLPGDFFYGAGGVEAPVGGADVYYGGGGYVIAGGGASSFAGASAYASARASVSVSTRFRGGYHHGGRGWGGHKGGGKH
ncbi:MAG: hypothetical protein IT546_09590 [Caulobacteraceae bacterium]|nr:hypothetical protein [Caulobacteraceae bacterium]